MESGISFWVRTKINGNWDNKMIRTSEWRENYWRTNKRSEEINKSKRAELWKSHSVESRKVSHLSNVVWCKKIYNKINRNCGNKIVKKSQWRKNHWRTSTRSEEMNKSRVPVLWELHSVRSSRVNHLSHVVWHKIIIIVLTSSIIG